MFWTLKRFSRKFRIGSSKLVMLITMFILVFTFSCAFDDGVEYGTLEFGGQKYKTVKIKGKTWMIENLLFDTKDDASFCPFADCAEYGRVYTWNAATQVCPSGWHLPKDGEFEKLRDDLRSDYCNQNYCGFIDEQLSQGWWSASEPYSFWYDSSGYANLQRSLSRDTDRRAVRCVKN